MATDVCAQSPEKSSTDNENGNSSSDGPFFQPIDWLSFGAATVAIFAVYLCTIAPEVTLETGGTFITGAAYAGVPDCPGFPLWTLYSWLCVKLIPCSNIAWRVTVGSAWLAALACGLTSLMVSRGGAMLLENTPAFTLRRPLEQNLLRGVCGWVAGLALGLCEAIWSEVARLNIWALSTLLFASMLALLMRWTVSPPQRRFLYAAVFLFGLLLTNSQFLVVVTAAFVFWVQLNDNKLGRELFLVSMVLYITGIHLGIPFFTAFPQLIAFVPCAILAILTVIKTRRVCSEWRAALLCCGLFLAGLGLYLYSALASMTNPPLNWGYPRTVEDFYRLVTRDQYDRLHPTRDIIIYLGQLVPLVQQVGGQLGWLYFLFIPAPFFLLRGANRMPRHWMLGLIAAFVCTGPVMLAMLNPSRDRTTVLMFQPYFSALYVVLAIWTGLGIMTMGAIAASSKNPA